MTVTITPTVEALNAPPRVRLDIANTGVDLYDDVTVTRRHSDGRTVPVRTATGAQTVLTVDGPDRTALLYDYEAPLGEPVAYSTLEDPGTVTADVIVPAQRVWLIHPGVPAMSQPIRVHSIGPRQRAARRGIFYPLGRERPVVQTDGQRKSPEYTLTVCTDNADQHAALEALVSDLGVLLLNVPAGKSWQIGAEYVSVGDLTETNEAGYGSWPRRLFELPCTVVDRPAGGTQSERSYADVLGDNATYADLMTAYPSYFDLLAGP